MKDILLQCPNEVIEEIISVFQNPSRQSAINVNKYSNEISEIAKAYEIIHQHSPEIAITMLRERSIPDNIIELLYEQTNSAMASTTENSSSKYVYTWRLDLSVPNVQAILLNIKNTENNTMQTMRMDLSTFHKLRFNVALLLKEQELLLNRVHK